jgi:hypothetical protein
MLGEVMELHGITSNSDNDSLSENSPVFQADDASFFLDLSTKKSSGDSKKEPKKKKLTELAKKRKLNSQQQSYINIHTGLVEYQNYNILPRIVKSDVRRQYATMFANVYNTGDYDYMMKYLHTFYKPDFCLSLKKHGKI